MRTITKIAMLFLIIINFSCSNKATESDNITADQLAAKKTAIENYINTFTCSENSGCGYIAFGSKPCGGPRMYLAFSNTINLLQLQTMVAEYNEMDQLRNTQTGAISDCSVPSPPNEILCVNGVCTIIN